MPPPPRRRDCATAPTWSGSRAGSRCRSRTPRRTRRWSRTCCSSATCSTPPGSSTCWCAATTNARSSPSTGRSARRCARPWPRPAPTRRSTPRPSTPRRPGGPGRRRPAVRGRRKARIFRLFRPRVHLASGLRYGASTGVQLELWRSATTRSSLPVENSLTRRSMPLGGGGPRHRRAVRPDLADASRTCSPTHATRHQLRRSTWCSPGSTGRQRSSSAQRAKRMQSYVVGDGDDSEARFRQIDELKYALRSVAHVRARGSAASSSRPTPTAPAWLADHPRVTIVRSEEFFADPRVLPTHNSHAVESQLHHIPGLAEHFLYSNDDMFFGRPVEPEHVLLARRHHASSSRRRPASGSATATRRRSGFENAARVNRRLLRERFGRSPPATSSTARRRCARACMRELEKEFPEDFAAHRGQPVPRRRPTSR